MIFIKGAQGTILLSELLRTFALAGGCEAVCWPVCQAMVTLT